MTKKTLDLMAMIFGLIGMICIAIIAIIDSHATDMVSSIPVQLLFLGIFLAGVISQKK